MWIIMAFLGVFLAIFANFGKRICSNTAENAIYTYTLAEVN